ncbi:hypothetical protein Barb6XT_00806 [Bacteroidales bacterium Barb6XT]|nr:hypothetical protein Barb6XT_00806 [Bacteroidales bacterium Barb6XT]
MNTLALENYRKAIIDELGFIDDISVLKDIKRLIRRRTDLPFCPPYLSIEERMARLEEIACQCDREGGITTEELEKEIATW